VRTATASTSDWSTHCSTVYVYTVLLLTLTACRDAACMPSASGMYTHLSAVTSEAMTYVSDMRCSV
jgi:hypothetical protein